jgi:hypothetical protein
MQRIVHSWSSTDRRVSLWPGQTDVGASSES